MKMEINPRKGGSSMFQLSSRSSAKFMECILDTAECILKTMLDFATEVSVYRSSHPEVFLRIGVLKICSIFTELQLMKFSLHLT